MPWAFKLDHLHPFRPLLSWKIFTISTFILGGQFLLPQRANMEFDISFRGSRRNLHTNVSRAGFVLASVQVFLRRPSHLYCLQVIWQRRSRARSCASMTMLKKLQVYYDPSLRHKCMGAMAWLNRIRTFVRMSVGLSSA